MNGLAGFLVFATGVGGLFFLDADKSSRTSRALWLPVVWLWIVASRPLSVWLGTGSGNGNLDATLDGSPTDAVFFGVLELAAIAVLLRRRNRTTGYLSGTVLIYFAFCLLSVLWSPYPDVTFKRWFKSLLDPIMVLVVLTDTDPIVALRKIYSRVGFVLLPTSLYLIRYSYLGHSFGPYGDMFNTGVTTNKNTFGMVTFVLALGIVWNLIHVLRLKGQPRRGRRLVAQGTVLAFGVADLQMAHSATSIACFLVGSALMIVMGLRAIRRSPGRIHALMLSFVIIAGVAMISGGQEDVAHSLGRNSDLTGRTEIWKTVLPMASNRVIGAGFESFWNAAHQKLSQIAGPDGELFHDLNSAHNGYIQVYLDLGLVGVTLIAVMFVTGYRRVVRAFRANPEVGALMLAQLLTAALYSITEAGFRLLTPPWIFLLVALIGAGGITRRYATGRPAAKDGRVQPSGEKQGVCWSDQLVTNR